MLKIDITIPLFYNNGNKIEKRYLDYIRDKLIVRFGGLTVINGIIGYWKDNNKLYTDINNIYSVIYDNNDFNLNWFKDFKQELKTLLQQKDIFMVINEVHLIE